MGLRHLASMVVGKRPEDFNPRLPYCDKTMMNDKLDSELLIELRQLLARAEAIQAELVKRAKDTDE
jgi:hypothetical protein